MDAILYHNACPDGFCAAFVAQQKYPEATLIPLDHGQSVEKIDTLIHSLAGKDVLMVDFSFRTREENDRLAFVAKSFLILDHHKTAEAVLAGANYAKFDMKRSGAGLAWDYLFGKDSGRVKMHYGNSLSDLEFQKDRPWYVDYVEDRDLWNWKLIRSKEVNAYIGTLPFTIEAWGLLRETSPDAASGFGIGALAHIEHYVREAVRHTQFGMYDGHAVAVLNITYLNCSEVGNNLAERSDFGITYFERADQMIQFSLRSKGEFDVSAIAKKFNGGGHKNAAGFTLPYLEGRKLIDTILGRGKTWDDVGPRHG